MALFQWKEYYSVNIDSVDLQHKQLVTLINSLHKEINNGFDREEVKSLLDHFMESTQSHFENEESLMLENDYKLYHLHKREHEQLIDDVKKFSQNLDESRSGVISELSNLIEKLKLHFLEMDKHYSPFLTSRGVC